MKKILALVLCVLTVLSVLASCSAAPAKNYSPKITVSSSAADEFAVWLTNRLGDSLKDNVYLSLGGDAANGHSNCKVTEGVCKLGTAADVNVNGTRKNVA